MVDKLHLHLTPNTQQTLLTRIHTIKIPRVEIPRLIRVFLLRPGSRSLILPVQEFLEDWVAFTRILTFIWERRCLLLSGEYVDRHRPVDYFILALRCHVVFEELALLVNLPFEYDLLLTEFFYYSRLQLFLVCVDFVILKFLPAPLKKGRLFDVHFI
jgi:hypothetical protein